MKILIIDDNLDTSSMLAKFLALKGHDCSVANDGRNGITLLDSKKFDVLLLDLAMPEFTGMDVLEQLYKNEKIGQVKIIVFTASSLKDEDEVDLKEKGVFNILRKPVDLKFLLETLGA